MAKIYVATSWRNQYQPLVVYFLRDLGHEVYDFRHPAPDNNGFRWFDVSPNWPKWTLEDYRSALLHPISEKGFKLDFDAMKWADVCILVSPCGASAHTEAGWMKGAGKPTVVYMPEKVEPELMYKIFDEIVLSLEELSRALLALESKKYTQRI